MYDQSLERRDVAIRSLYRMWHRGKGLRKELLALGLSEANGALAFQDQPYPRTERLIFEAIRRCYAIMPAAELLIAEYIRRFGDLRKAYYLEKKKPA